MDFNLSVLPQVHSGKLNKYKRPCNIRRISALCCGRALLDATFLVGWSADLAVWLARGFMHAYILSTLLW